MLTDQEVEKLQENGSGYIGERSKPKRQKSSTKLSELNENQDSPVVSKSAMLALRHLSPLFEWISSEQPHKTFSLS